MSIEKDILACTLCQSRFATTQTSHSPRPVTWFKSSARILIAGQAPGMKVHKSGRPFTDPSGDRLRDWMGVDEDVFYDKTRIAIVPMAFCFPGYTAKGSDLPPPPICAKTWRADVLQALPNIRLTLVIGAHALKYHLPGETKVAAAVQNWQSRPNDVFVLPHPSWRNTGWLRKNPWFGHDVLPLLRTRIKEVLHD